MNWILVGLLGFSLYALWIYSDRLRASIEGAPKLEVASTLPISDSTVSDSTVSDSTVSDSTVTVVVPAYNEAENIEACLLSVLNSTTLPASTLTVWMVDDQSTDQTWAIAQSLQQRLNDPRLRLLAGQPRPTGERWMGKNWACTQVAEQSESEFLLFIDADVRLKPGAIETALQAMQQEQVDLLSFGPVVICGCLAEWLAQPVIVSALMVGYDFAAVNDPTTDTAFAAGPFMLFRRSAYEKIGGHRAVADQVVEDVELSRRVKYSGLKLRYLLGKDLVDLRMYRSWGALWEGWTKNFYLGSQRNFPSMVRFILFTLLFYVVPWLGLITALGQFGLAIFGLAIFGLATSSETTLSASTGILLALSLLGTALQYRLRQILSQSGILPNYWWLSGLGGLAVVAIAVGSIIKTETGWGWTWRGRALQQPKQI